MEPLPDEDVFTCPETRDRMRQSVYELRLSTLTEIYKAKLSELEIRTKSILSAIPEGVKSTRVGSFK